MDCPFCCSKQSTVRDTYRLPRGIQRVRKCSQCKRNFETLEAVTRKISAEEADKVAKDMLENVALPPDKRQASLTDFCGKQQ